MTPERRKILLVPILLSLLLFSYPAYYFGAKAWGTYSWNKKTAAFMDALQKPFREDTYGGKTPEETAGKLIALVESGDLVSASKLYDVRHQEKAYQRMLGYKNTGTLHEWTENLKTFEKDKVQNGQNIIYYSYRYLEKESGKYFWAPLAFYKNPLTNVWKIVY